MDDREFTFGDLMRMEMNPPMSGANRIGYLYGYGAAFMNFYGLMCAGVSKEAAYERCCKFWLRELIEWARDYYAADVPPPQLKMNI